MEIQLNSHNIADIENDGEIDYYKSLEKKIDLYEKLIYYGKLITLFFLLAFLTLLSIKICATNSISWLLLLIPGITTIISSTIVVNLYLKEEDIIDSLEKKDVNIGTLISYFCINIISISLITYLILFCLKMNKTIDTQFSIISIPLFVLLGVSSFYLIFIFPALVQSGMYFEILLVVSYILNTFLFLLMLNYKLDQTNSVILFRTIFSPVWVALSIHFTYVSYFMIVKEESFLRHGFFYLFTICTLVGTIALILKMDKLKLIPSWLICVFGMSAVLFFVLEYFVQHILKSDDQEFKKL